MDLYEYQGKQYFARYGIPTSPGAEADSVEEALEVAARIGYPVVLKAQVKVGGRGKAGGIKLAAGAEEVREHAAAILGMDIKGHTVHRLWIERSSEISREWYASFTLDRSAKKHLCMLSAKGGVDIEEVAASDPDAIVRRHIDPVEGLSAAQAADLVARAGLVEGLDEAEASSVSTQAAELLVKLYTCYVEGDCDLAEINPLILTTDGRVHALDAKVTLDDNASFRHADWADMAATDDMDERERLAREKGLQYVGLDGFVGIIANGAGLAMSTCDVVEQVGGEPANFLDIGGGANADQMANALEVINSDPKVRSIFINIFGGITRGEEVANGIVQALDRVELKAPIVIRLDGTNAEEGRSILAQEAAGRILSSPTMIEAARKAAELAGEPRVRTGGTSREGSVR